MKISLKTNDKIFTEDDYKVDDELSSFFENAVKALNIKPKGFSLYNTSNLSNPVEVTIKTFGYYPNILPIKENVPLF